MAVKALRPIGVEPDALRMQVEDGIGHAPPVPFALVRPGWPCRQKVLNSVLPEALAHRTADVGTGYLLLAQFHGEGPASHALVGLGAATWVTGSILKLGGHRAVALMAAHTNPIQTTNSIAFTIDMVAAAFALAAFASIGLGMLAVAAAAAREHAGHHAWASYTTLIALTLLVLAWSYATSN